MLRILHLEDDPLDAELILETLREEGFEAESERVETLETFRARLEQGGHGLILSDFTLPGVDPLEALGLARRLRPEAPFLFVSGTIAEDQAIEVLKMGASDYVFKQRLGRLGPSVRRALREAEQEAGRRQAEAALSESRRNLEQMVAQRTAQLAEANANLQTFAYTAAHDLRSPLRAIKSFTAFTLEDFAEQLSTEARSNLARVVQSAAQMEHLLNDLLEYSKLAQAEVTLAAVDLNQAVSEALKLQQEDIRAKNAQITVADSMPQALGHPASVVLIITNFVSNALKFVPPGVEPRIQIRAELVQSSEFKAHGLPSGAELASRTDALPAPPPVTRPASPTVRLWVEDNGIGIAAKDIQRLFAAFHRLHGKQDYPGTGLGLAIVRKGAERMGGQVGVESEPGKGSRFWLELPAATRTEE